jgi:hypothetical protein
MSKSFASELRGEWSELSMSDTACPQRLRVEIAEDPTFGSFREPRLVSSTGARFSVVAWSPMIHPSSCWLLAFA